MDSRKKKEPHLHTETFLTDTIALTLLSTGGILSFVGFIIGMFFQTSFLLNLPNLLMALLCLSMLIFMRSDLKTPLKIVLFTVGYFYFPFIFLTNNGLHGSAPFYFLMVFLYIAFFFRGKALVLHLSTTLLFYIFLITLTYFHPRLITPYPDELSQFIDMLIGFVSVAVVSTIITSTSYREYQLERDLVTETAEKLHEKNALLKQMLITDHLTEVYSRQFFLERGEEMFAESGKECALLMIDIDHFKQVNDTFGHSAGDEILKRIADQIRSQVSDEGIVSRYGGEEFTVLLPDVSLEAGQRMAERIRSAVEQLKYLYLEKCTVSIGVSSSAEAETMMDLIEVADTRLYQAKNRGRNQVVS